MKPDFIIYDPDISGEQLRRKILEVFNLAGFGTLPSIGVLLDPRDKHPFCTFAYVLDGTERHVDIRFSAAAPTGVPHIALSTFLHVGLTTWAAPKQP